MIDLPPEATEATVADDPNARVHVTFTAPKVTLDVHVSHALLIVPSTDGHHMLHFSVTNPVEQLGEMLATFLMLLENHPAGAMAMAYARSMAVDEQRKKKKIITLG